AGPASACSSCESVHYCGESHQELDACFHQAACARLREIREDEAFRRARSVRELSVELLERRAGARGPRVLEGWDAYLATTAFTEPAHRRVLTDLASRPLTVAHLLRELGGVQNGPIRVHVMAASAKELESLALYTELAALFPESRFEIALIGPELPVAPLPSSARVRLCLRADIYRRASWAELGRPQLVVGFDAGLLLYRSWGRTLLELIGSGVPFAITSYRSWEATAEAALLRRLGAVPLCPPRPNPFASEASRRSTTVANDVSRDNSYLS